MEKLEKNRKEGSTKSREHKNSLTIKVYASLASLACLRVISVYVRKFLFYFKTSSNIFKVGQLLYLSVFVIL